MTKQLEVSRQDHTPARVTTVKSLAVDKLRLLAEDGELVLAGVNMRLSPLAICQVCQMLLIPAGYVGRLPATLAAQNINHALKGLRDGNVSLLVNEGRMVVVEVRL